MSSGGWASQPAWLMRSRARRNDGRGAGFDGDDEGEIAFLVAGALEEGVDVDFFCGEGAGDFGDDARAILHDEADVVAELEFAADMRGRLGRSAARDPWASEIRSETTATAVGLPPAPWPEKTTSPPYWPLTRTMFSVLARPGEGRTQGDEHGADGRRRRRQGEQFGFGDLADGAVEVVGVDEVDGIDLR